MSFEVISSGQLRQYIEKVERLEEEKADLMEAIREVFGEAKGNGFDVKIMKQVLKMRKMKQEELMEQEELLTLYLQALGMAPAAKLGEGIEEAA
ncbi:MAG: DUF2312 domain-containing protein [Alphaproteobacteria bacterium]|jgi:uncharacterized protein (UPF0335 family)|nr:DUF2312 domain-containing protein [Alphaproteobacteria bacterium]